MLKVARYECRATEYTLAFQPHWGDDGGEFQDGTGRVCVTRDVTGAVCKRCLQDVKIGVARNERKGPDKTLASVCVKDHETRGWRMAKQRTMGK